MIRIAVIFSLSALSACYGTKIDVGQGGEVYFKSPVTEAQARAAGDYLKAIGFLGDGPRKTVQLTREGKAHQVRFVVKEGMHTDEAAGESLTLVAGLLTHQVFKGEPVVAHLCDKGLKTLKSIDVPKEVGDLGKRFPSEKNEIYLKPPLDSAAQAERIAKMLRTAGLFKPDRNVSVAVKQQGALIQFCLIVDKTKVNDAVRAYYKKLAFSLSVETFRGGAVQAQFCTRQMLPYESQTPIQAGTRYPAGKGAIYYAAPVTEAEATMLASELHGLGYFTATRDVALRREGEAYAVKFVVVDQASLQRPDVHRAVAGVAQKLSWHKQGKLKAYLTDGFFVPSVPLRMGD
jgi:hypothetical protein